MGYSTNFVGQFDLDKELTLSDFNQLNDFALERHDPPGDMPGIWCSWIPTKDGKGIEWSGMEKFQDYCEWLQYLIATFFTPKGYKLTGQVAYDGDAVDDTGVLAINKEGVAVAKPYVPQDEELIDLVKKGLRECDEDGDAYWYLEEVGKKLGIEVDN